MNDIATPNKGHHRETRPCFCWVYSPFQIAKFRLRQYPDSVYSSWYNLVRLVLLIEYIRYLDYSYLPR